MAFSCPAFSVFPPTAEVYQSPTLAFSDGLCGGSLRTPLQGLESELFVVRCLAYREPNRIRRKRRCFTPVVSDRRCTMRSAFVHSIMGIFNGDPRKPQSKGYFETNCRCPRYSFCVFDKPQKADDRMVSRD